MTETPESTFADKVREISEKIKNTWNMMAQRIGEFIINLPEQWCAYAVLIGIAVAILLGLIFIILRKTTYGEMLMSAGFCMGILTLLLCASGLGLPMLMDPARCSIYYVYLLILTLTVLMDGILYLIFMRRLFTIPRNVLSFILTVSGTDYNRNLLQNYTDDTYFVALHNTQNLLIHNIPSYHWDISP